MIIAGVAVMYCLTSPSYHPTLEKAGGHRDQHSQQPAEEHGGLDKRTAVPMNIKEKAPPTMIKV